MSRAIQTWRQNWWWRDFAESNWSRECLILTYWWQLLNKVTAPRGLIAGPFCKQGLNPANICESSSTLAWRLFPALRPPRTRRKFGMTWRRSGSEMPVLRNEEKDTGPTKGRFFLCCIELFGTLAVDGKFMLILAATCTVGFVWWRDVEEHTKAGSICARDGEAGWERDWRLMKKEKPGQDGLS